jgi:hypothetical protein
MADASTSDVPPTPAGQAPRLLVMSEATPASDRVALHPAWPSGPGAS